MIGFSAASGIMCRVDSIVNDRNQNIFGWSGAEPAGLLGNIMLVLRWKESMLRKSVR